MSLKIKVKISAVNNLSDARYCAGMGVSYLGFDLNEQSDRYIARDEYEAIMGWVSGVERVVEVDTLGYENITETIQNYSFDYIQCSEDQLDKLKANYLRKIFLKLDFENCESRDDVKGLLDQYSEIATCFIYSSPSDRLFDEVVSVSQHYPLLVGSGIGAENIAALVSEGIYGIEMRGGDEISPGYKDYDELADILELLETDEE